MLLLLTLIVIIGITIVFSFLYGISPTPTSPTVKKKMLSLLPPLEESNIIELGSGWGGVVFSLARHFPSCKVIGYEISPIPYLYSKWILSFLFLPNLRLERRDFFQESFSQAKLVVCYLYPEAMERLKVKFENELSPESYVLSHTFAIPGWKPLLFDRANDLYQTPIYLYQMEFLEKSHISSDCNKTY